MRLILDETGTNHQDDRANTDAAYRGERLKGSAPGARRGNQTLIAGNVLRWDRGALGDLAAGPRILNSYNRSTPDPELNRGLWSSSTISPPIRAITPLRCSKRTASWFLFLPGWTPNSEPYNGLFKA